MPADSRYGRGQAVARPARNLPGMPVTMPGQQDEEFAPPRRQRFPDDESEDPDRRWWRPSSKWGRIFLACGILTAAVVLTTGGYIFKSWLERDSRFRITGSGNIEASGLSEVTRADVLPVFGEDIGRNIFHVPLSQRRQQLEKIPWVEKATVMRILPDQLRVSLVERKPVAFVRHGQQIGLVDANGVLLTMSTASMAKRHYSFPVVTGIDGGDPLPSRKARMAVYGRLIAELDSTGQHLSEQISEIDLTDPEDARVLMPEQGTDILAHFGDDQFLARYQRYKAHIAEWRQQYPRLASVDLRYEQQVVLEMAPGSGGTQTTTDDGKPATEATQPAPKETVAKPPAGVRQAAKPAPHKAPVRPKAGKAKSRKRALVQKRAADFDTVRQTASTST